MKFMLMMRLAILATSVVCGHAALAQSEAADHAASEHAGGEHAGGHGHELGHGNAAPGMESMTEVRTDLAIYTLAVFLLLMLLLGSFVWPKISAALLEREKRIEGNLAAAAAKHEEAKRLLAEQEARLAGAAAEVKALMEEARRDAEAAKADILRDAKSAAQQESQRALREIDTAQGHAMKSIAETSANLAVDLAGKVIRETIKPDKAQELVREALSRLGDSAVSRN
jgi:F-type H+-transporting ATPase subunit b